MEPFEIMISESQERMLCVVEPERSTPCSRSARAGRSTPPRSARSRTRAGCACSTARRWSATCPSRRWSTSARPTTSSPPSPRRRCTRRRRASCPRDDPGEILLTLLGSANLASRRWAFEQYDSIVGSRTVRRPESADAAVLLLRDGDGDDPLTVLYPADGDGARPAIAVAIDGNGRRVAADPYRGAVEAVLECSANLACVGAEPLGLTNCLNFGNPEKPHIAWQLTRAIAGLGDACRAFGIPVVGGNVSLYNEGGERPDLPDAGRRPGR